VGGCPGNDVFAAFLDGTLTEEGQEELERHIDECSACRSAMAALARSGEGPTVPAPPPPTPGTAGPARTGRPIGRFQILERLGEGGMGTVYAAYDPSLDRRVAVKLLGARAAGSSEGRQRLLREARAMARLVHPNVLTVHEAGTHEGQVYVAMEYAPGGTLTRWLREAPRTWREIVAVYAAAGRGLAAAHAAGLVHRDFKPDNVLMTQDGTPRVADFGLVGQSGVAEPSASSSSGADLSPGFSTRTGSIMGTLAYMAPEQRDGRVDARADQYAFCVALYRALYGASPFGGAKDHERLAHQRRDEVSEAPAGATVPPWLRAVILRGLRADAEERYPSMTALLAGLAADPEAVRRRRLRLAAVVAAVLLVAGGAAVLGHRLAPAAAATPRCDGGDADLAAVWDEGARGRVRAAFAGTGRPYAADTAARVIRLLDEYAGAYSAMRRSSCEDTYLRGRQSTALLDLRARCLDQRRARFAALVGLLAEKSDPAFLDRAVTAVTGLDPIAECADAEALAAAVPLPPDPVTRARVAGLRARLEEAAARRLAGRYADGLAMAAPVVEEARGLAYPPLLAEALFAAGLLTERGGDPSKAEGMLREALVTAARAHDDALGAHIVTELGFVIGDRLARPAEALALRPFAEAALARAGAGDADSGAWENSLGLLLIQLGRYDEARVELERAVALRERAFGPDHIEVARSVNNLGIVAESQGRLDDARAYDERALHIFETTLGPSHPYVSSALVNLALVCMRTGRLDEASLLLTRALAVREGALGPDHPEVTYPLTAQGMVLIKQGRCAEAVPLLERAARLAEKGRGADHPLIAFPLTSLGDALRCQGRGAEAVAVLERAVRIREVSGRNDPVELARSRFALAQALPAKERARALTLARTAEAAFAAAGPRTASERTEVEDWLKGK
jgi:eukaryotic-like serine/threonine-protein kinase